jgi:hypothetical protein
MFYYFILIFIIIWPLILVLQLAAGIAVMGLPLVGTVERERSPGPFWFSIALQVIGWFLIAALITQQLWQPLLSRAQG